MKQLILTSAFFLLCQFSFAQYESFDLSKYKLPDIKRHQLDFNFNSHGDFSHDYIVQDNEYLQDTTDQKNNQFNGFLNLQYSYYKNASKVQSSANLIFSSNYGKIEQAGTENNNYENENTGSALRGNYDLRYFLSTENWFLRGVPMAEFSYTGINYSNNKRKFLSTSESFLFEIGKGRVEQVQDFRHALLLLQDIEKRGLAKKELSEDEIIELASLISSLKNERFFDSRIKMESDLEQIDSLLKAKNVIDVDDIRYFNSLSDMWRYGDLVSRKSGTEIGLSIRPGHSFNNRDLNHDYSDEDMIEEDFTINYGLSFSSYNPLSIKWQADYQVGLSHLFANELQNVNNEFTQKYYQSNAYFSGSLGYYPNTRTALYFRTNLNLQNQSFNEDKKIDKDRYKFECLVHVDAYYYISERLRLNGSFSMLNIYGGLFNSKWGHAKNHQYNYNLTLNYAIF